MEFKIEKSELVSGLVKTQSIVEKRNAMPALVNILMQADKGILRIFATDLEVSLIEEISINLVKAGQVAVDAKQLFNIIRELNEGPIHFKSKENNWLEIKQNKSIFNIVGIAPEEYPIFPSYTTKEFVKIQAQVFSDMIEKTIYSVSNDETRYHMNGVYFEQIKSPGGIHYRMVATDGHRLSIVDRKIDTTKEFSSPSGVIIPRKGLYEIKKVLESIDEEFVEIAVEGPQLVFKTSATVLMVRLIEGRYPNYQQFVPNKLKNKAQASRERLISSLKRVSLLSNQKSKGVTMALSQGNLKITSNNPELGDAKEELDIDYTGDDFKIGFNAKYILDILNSFNDNEVNIELNDQLSPGVIRPLNDTDYTCVIMPMRI